MTLTDRIKELATSFGYSFASLERDADLGRGTIRKWDVNMPSADKLQKVALLLNTSMDYLMSGKSAPCQVFSEELSKDECEMLTLFRQLPQKEQYKLMGRMEEKIESLHDDAKAPVAAGILLQAK